MIGIDERHFILLENNGFRSKNEAYNVIALRYRLLRGVTVFFNHKDGLWYIVQSKALMA